MNNQEILHKFYTSFAAGYADAMVSCYHENIIFQDPVFGRLCGEDAKNMWRMLLERSKGNLKITFTNIQSDENTGSANWVAVYPFSLTGRTVTNKTKASFTFIDGKIATHTDTFDLWGWCRQAFGWKGVLLGWTPMMQSRLKQQSQQLLTHYTNKQKEAK